MAVVDGDFIPDDIEGNFDDENNFDRENNVENENHTNDRDDIDAHEYEVGNSCSDSDVHSIISISLLRSLNKNFSLCQAVLW
jgi:hypothetical protein